jgi:DNA-binding Xre family transcriptional regulator
MGMMIFKKKTVDSKEKFVLDIWMENKSSPPKTWAELARTADVSESLLEKIKMGILQVTTNIQCKLCEVTGYDVGDICTYDRNKEPKK